MAGLGVFGAFVTLLVFAFRDKEEIAIPAEQITRFYQDHPVEVVL
jgi:cytochrome o ubiquinol oxidase subunit 1